MSSRKQAMPKLTFCPCQLAPSHSCPSHIQHTVISSPIIPNSKGQINPKSYLRVKANSSKIETTYLILRKLWDRQSIHSHSKRNRKVERRNQPNIRLKPSMANMKSLSSNSGIVVTLSLYRGSQSLG